MSINYKHEYGRYKKKVEDQAKEIANLKYQLEGYEQTQQITNAFVGAVLEQYGINDESKCVIVSREAVNDVLANCIVRAAGVENGYALWLQRQVNNDGSKEDDCKA